MTSTEKKPSIKIDRATLALRALQKKDSSINTIIATASHVAMYHFLDNTKKWERSEVEGALHIVQRTVEPYFQFIIINRLSPTDVNQTINLKLQFQDLEPYIYYQDPITKNIYGLWFYNSEERNLILRKLEMLTGQV